MLLRAIVAFLALPVIVAGIVPYIITLIPAPLWWKSFLGILPISTGVLILIISAVSFYRRGKGTLAPWDPPKHLVVQDLYRYNRNPMYVGVILTVLGWAILTGNPWNDAYAILLCVVFHLRVVLYEEKEMERLFGNEWESYRSEVPRWGWRLPYAKKTCEHPLSPR